MRNVLGVLTLAVVLVGAEGWSCGDKFLVIGRGVRAQRAKGAVHRASILLYLDPRTGLPEAARESSLEANLKLAGHTIRSVNTRGALETALSGGSYDIVVLSLADMKAVQSRAASTSSPPPVLLPVLFNPTPEEMADAERQYRCVMRSPSKKQHFLGVIDEALVVRSKSAKAPDKER